MKEEARRGGREIEMGCGVGIGKDWEELEVVIAEKGKGIMKQTEDMDGEKKNDDRRWGEMGGKHSGGDGMEGEGGTGVLIEGRGEGRETG